MIIMIGCVLLLVAALALGKFLQIRALIAAVPKPAPQTVSTAQVQKLQWQTQFTAVGTLNPVRGADLSTEVAGLVRTVHFKSGQDVKAGALLVELNADSDIALLHSAEAAAAQAATVLKRDQAQLAVQAVSQAQIDADTNDLKAKRAQVEQQAAVVAKKSIRAPFSGRLGITALNPGQYVNAGDKLVTLQTLDPIYADFSLPQQQLAGLAVGQVVNLTVDTFPGQSFTGKINAISPKVDSATRNVQVEATVSNPKLLLLPGMFANVKIDIGGVQEQLTLPSTAVTYNPYGSTVYVVKEAEPPKAGSAGAAGAAGTPAPAANPSGKPQLIAEQVFIETGPTRGDQISIVKGLKAGQVVVSSGQNKLKNGSPVTVDNSVQPTNDAAPTPQEK
ncbi:MULTISPECIES: efflux RND transporter periplasmic adaptor subunit [Variovorax]|jgi:membrane fusion protein (multidrug efflux system)|uniref:efflux RND transporter periplasmic adaptor subunit n=1 Tax=Variovorax TaxID=34072 RepID=UPI0015A22D25|nr:MULTISPECIES: efflux RND transporter periplasmic adaptor subunit [Variovorax]MDQ0080509.1 membrane fusion protein (multidrug efflux system) [Variovorax boronicumulans]